MSDKPSRDDIEFNLVRFAVNGDNPRYYALTDKQYDRWLEGQPQEGYKTFECLGDVILTPETADEVVKIMSDK